MAFKAASITLDEETRAELERRVRAGTYQRREAKRARIILLAAEGVSSRRIWKQVEMHESHVAMWRQRFLAEGLSGLGDAGQHGRAVLLDRHPQGPLARQLHLPRRSRLKVMRFITSYNETAKPFAWTYSGQPLKTAA